MTDSHPNPPLPPKNLARRLLAVEVVTASILLGLVLSVVGGVVFALIAQDITGSGGLVRFDTHLSTAFYAQATPFSTGLYRAVTFFGGIGGWVVAAVVGMVLLMRRRWSLLAVWVIGIFGGGVLNLILKTLYARPRPVFEVLLAVEASFSFPSAHAMTSLVTYGLLMYLLWRQTHSRVVRILLAFALVLLVLFIGISRMALGVHYFSDVVAGYAAGALWLGVCIIILHILERRTAAS